MRAPRGAKRRVLLLPLVAPLLSTLTCSLTFDRATAAAANYETISILHANVLDVNMDAATVVFVYLVPVGLKLCADKLLSVLQRGGRIASYMFSLPGLEPKETFASKGGCKVRRPSERSERGRSNTRGPPWDL